MRKPGEKFLTGRENLKGLVADFCHTARHADIMVIAKHASEGVARKASGTGLLPSYDHARVQAAGERHADRLASAELARKVPGKNFAERLVVGLRIEFFLGFPFARIKVIGFFLQPSVPKDPGGSRRQDVDAVKERAV